MVTFWLVEAMARVSNSTSRSATFLTISPLANIEPPWRVLSYIGRQV